MSSFRSEPIYLEMASPAGSNKTKTWIILPGLVLSQLDTEMQEKFVYPQSLPGETEPDIMVWKTYSKHSEEIKDKIKTYPKYF